MTLIGRQLAHYRIEAALGSGGMGEVYRAWDTRLEREVAIKILPSDLASDPDYLARFRREARALAALDHPGIVTVHSVEEAQGVHFLTMQLVEGRSLEHLVAVPGLVIERLLEIAVELTDALAAAHDKGIVHRDLKPANVMVTREGRVKVLDFGLARIEAGATSTTDSTLETRALTRQGVVMGTMPYMSPEQLRGEPLDRRTDVFSLGVVLYELATGNRPFDRDSNAELASAILRDRPPSLVGLRPDLPEGLSALMERCLEKQPFDRFRSARRVHDELQSLARTGHASTGADSSKPGLAPTESPSIAVLPLRNLSADPENQYLSDGLSEEIINALTRISGLRVIARTSAFRFRDEQDLRKVGESLRVKTVLEGSVQKAGDRLRVTAQLIDVTDDSTLWSERFDRRLTDVFAIQHEIAGAIVDQLEVRLAGPRPLARPPRKIEAYEALLEGRRHWNRFSPEGLEKALACYERALTIDPDYTDVIVEMAWYFSVVAWVVQAPLAALSSMSALAVRALALEPDHGDALGALAFATVWRDLDWQASERLFHRAMTLAPASANHPALYGVLCCLPQGRFAEATSFIDRGIELDPLAPRARALEARVLLFERRFEDAEASIRRTLELDPVHPLSLVELGYALLFQQRFHEALAVGNEAIDRHGPLKTLVPIVGLAHAMAGERDQALAFLERTERSATAEHYVSPGARVFVHAALSELDAAFAWAERALEEREFQMLYLAVHPVFDPLRDDARYSQLLERIHLGQLKTPGGVSTSSASSHDQRS